MYLCDKRNAKSITMRKALIICICLVTHVGQMVAQVATNEWKGKCWNSSYERLTAVPLNDTQVWMMGNGIADAGYGFIFEVKKKGDFTYDLQPISVNKVKKIPSNLNEFQKNVLYSGSNTETPGITWQRKIVDGKDLIIKRNNGAVSDIYILSSTDLLKHGQEDVKDLLCGHKNVDANGREFTFRWDGGCTFADEVTTYTILNEEYSPAPIIQLKNGKTFYIVISTKGMSIYYAVFNKDIDSYEKGNQLYKNVVATKEYPRWSFLSEDVFCHAYVDYTYRTKEVLTLMRNEIFARHGYRFSDPTLKNYFESCDWYKPATSNSEVRLSELESLNVSLIKYCEKECD